ncbi:MAG: CAP domain-containing protein [Geitlerinemataceae cyanobacterium]
MSVNIYSNLSGDGLEAEERKLYEMVNDYRALHGLPAVSLSKALTTVANRHAQDLSENIGYLTHSWSDAPFNSSDSSTWSNMWTAPQRLQTGYSGYGYENAYWNSAGVTAENSLLGWQNSPAHNSVILNKNGWEHLNWQAVGVGIYGEYAVLWFGEEVDPTGSPISEGINPTPRSNSSATSTLLSDLMTGTNYDFGIATAGNDTYSHAQLSIEQANLFQSSIGIDAVVLLGGNDSAIDDGGSRIYFGNAGDDTIQGNGGNDTIVAGRDRDSISGGEGDDALFGNLGDDLVQGGNGEDLLFGGQDNDRLYGDAGDDVVSGDFGNDIIAGNLGIDTLTGGEGNDTFVLQTAQGRDILTDFQRGSDVIQVSGGIRFSDLTLQSSGTNGEDTIVKVTSTGEELAILKNVRAADLNSTDFGETSSTSDSFEERIVQLVNEARSQNGLAPVTVNLQLMTAAETHSQNMATQDFFSHTGADGSKVSDRTQAVGYRSTFVGENIGAGYTSPEAAFEKWIDSAGHQENILNPNYTEIGVGYVFLDNDTGNVNHSHYWTQVFGTPL